MESADRITVRLIMPDRWLEHVMELSTGTSVADVKALGLREILQRSSDDPADFYVEYSERGIADESQTLGEVGVETRGVMSIRAYDLGHNRRFKG